MELILVALVKVFGARISEHRGHAVQIAKAVFRIIFWLVYGVDREGLDACFTLGWHNDPRFIFEDFSERSS